MQMCRNVGQEIALHCLACGTEDRPVVRFTPNGVIEACPKCTAPIVAERPIANGAFLANASPVGEQAEVSEPVPLASDLPRVGGPPERLRTPHPREWYKEKTPSPVRKEPEDFISKARRRLTEIRRELRNHDKLVKEEAAICMMLNAMAEMSSPKSKH